MAVMRAIKPQMNDIVEVSSSHADAIGHQFDEVTSAFHGGEERVLRTFTSSEAASLIGCSDAYVRMLAPTIPVGKDAAGRWIFSLEQVHAMRRQMVQTGHLPNPQRSPLERVQVISVANFKGGSGKTTTSVHLAQYLALRGYRVLAVDLDPQASLSTILGQIPDIDTSMNETVYAALRYYDPVPLKSVIRSTHIAGLDLIPANQELQEFEFETPKFMMEHPTNSVGVFTRLVSALATVEDDYDVIVLDSAPNLGFMTLNAMVASGMILVTIHPQMLDVYSMQHFLQMFSGTMGVIRSKLGRAPDTTLRYLLTRFEPSDRPQNQVAQALRALLPHHVLNAVALKSTAVADAGLGQQTLYEVSLSGSEINRSAYNRAIESMNTVNAEIEAILKGTWGRTS